MPLKVSVLLSVPHPQETGGRSQNQVTEARPWVIYVTPQPGANGTRQIWAGFTFEFKSLWRPVPRDLMSWATWEVWDKYKVNFLPPGHRCVCVDERPGEAMRRQPT